jgi:hypothetical protein
MNVFVTIDTMMTDPIKLVKNVFILVKFVLILINVLNVIFQQTEDIYPIAVVFVQEELLMTESILFVSPVLILVYLVKV